MFKWKDYRIEGPGRYKTMTLDTHEFHRIRHYALLASGNRAANIARGSLIRPSNFTVPAIPTLRPKLRKVPRGSLSMAMSFDSSLRKGQQLKQRVPAQIKFSTHPLCFDFSTTCSLAGRSLPESCPKNGDLPKSPLLSIGSVGAIGEYDSNLKIDLGLHCGCRRHPQTATRAPLVACALN